MEMDTLTNGHLSFAELREAASLFHKLVAKVGDSLAPSAKESLRKIFAESRGVEPYDSKGLPHLLMTLRTADVFADMIDTDMSMILAILLHDAVDLGLTDIMNVRREFGEDVASILTGLSAVARFSGIDAVRQDNFRGLLISLADDIRVIIIMIVRELVLMRNINNHPDSQWVSNVAFEANCLYAQLAHRLGLYKIKGELEDLSLKYTNREIYTQIARKLNETKRSRDAYIAAFIKPLSEKLTAAGLKFDIKGRTKSISSIWAKMRKQKVDIDRIYDLFAIRVIIDTPPEKEKADCWLAYSILGDMYTPNPNRMRDWISIPKSNGYESLHATVLGPGNKWVEVQFRTRRMDLVAEKGLAAHWRYKGVKSDSTDQWMNNIRDILESAESGPMELMKDLRRDIYTQEVFAFTPKGDLFKMPAGATVLDFAFQIHSNVGAHCTGAIVNGQHRKINYKIQSGDTIEIVTSTTQTPKPEWLNIVVSPKSRNKIKQKLNEERQKLADLGKETLERRAKNRKIELDEALLMKLVKKEGYKYASEFFADITEGKIDPAKFLATYQEAAAPDQEAVRISAEEFRVDNTPDESSDDILVIGEKAINGLKYKFAKCCNPINGDDVFGFISADGMVKIHKKDCPNARNIRERYPYRLIRVNWSGRQGDLMSATLRIIGTDDLGIIANITSIISKEANVILRNISVDSHDGLFRGYLVVGVPDNQTLASLTRKIRTVKGVKDVIRS